MVDNTTRWKRVYSLGTWEAEQIVRKEVGKLIKNRSLYTFVGTKKEPVYKNLSNGAVFPVSYTSLWQDISPRINMQDVCTVALIYQKPSGNESDPDEAGPWMTEDDVRAAGIDPWMPAIRSFESIEFSRKRREARALEKEKKEENSRKQKERVDMLRAMRAEGKVDKVTLCRVMVCDDVDPLVTNFINERERMILLYTTRESFLGKVNEIKRAWFSVSCGRPILSRVRAAVLVFLAGESFHMHFKKNEISRFFNCTAVSLRNHVTEASRATGIGMPAGESVHAPKS